jgi:uncharacterized membrane protein YedE/YeeE
MKRNLVSFLVGLIFAIGLGLAGMTQPQKIIGFLDVFGSWDPSLLFVMAGAVGIHFASYRLIRKRNSPILSVKWEVPTSGEVTKPLLLGSFIFGVGWGLSGFCPGPALVSLASGEGGVFLFVIGMIAGLILFNALYKKVKFKL